MWTRKISERPNPDKEIVQCPEKENQRTNEEKGPKNTCGFRKTITKTACTLAVQRALRNFFTFYKDIFCL